MLGLKQLKKNQSVVHLEKAHGLESLICKQLKNYLWSPEQREDYRNLEALKEILNHAFLL